MKTDMNPDHYRFHRCMPHSGHAIEPPDSVEHVPAALRRGAVLIVLLVAILCVVEVWR